ncbi:MAG: hypothetical protein LWX83_17405, partial [Anaerolineae bacterium]|nr:hypothetical protein [Anaerolineae bacterium]
MNTADSYGRIWDNCLMLLEQSGNNNGASRLLKNTRLLRFSPEDKTFIIRTPDPASAEWLADRAAPQLTRYLCGLTNDWDVQVAFVPEEPEALLNPPGKATPELKPSGIPGETLRLVWVHKSAREIVLQPERVLSLPRYLLRWLPYASPAAILLWIALYQIHYLKTGGKRGTERERSIDTGYEEMARWSGLSLITVKRLFKDHQKIDWFLERGPNRYVTRPDGSVRPQLNIRMRAPGLTPGDSADLSRWLVEHDFIQDPEACLKLALSLHPREILVYPLRLPAAGDQAVNGPAPDVAEVLAGLLGKALNPPLLILAESLATHLGLSGGGDRFLTVSWYFMQKNVALLGDSLAVFILFCRSLIYHHAASGVTRNDFWLSGGAESIAALAGVKRDRVMDWFKPGQAGGGQR